MVDALDECDRDDDVRPRLGWSDGLRFSSDHIPKKSTEGSKKPFPAPAVTPVSTSMSLHIKGWRGQGGKQTRMQGAAERVRDVMTLLARTISRDPRLRNICPWSKLVLVLDVEVIGSTSRCGLEKILMQINRSRWLTRLWTFQEAVLAKRLVFQFSEGSVDMPSLEAVAREERQRNTLGDIEIVLQAIEFWVCFLQLQDSSTSQAKKLGLLCRDVGGARICCSRAEDESISYAGILDIDLQKLLEANGDHRMQLFWSLQSQIPLALLFEPGQRLQNDGFRWAHSSLLNTRMADDYQVRIDSNRAFVELQGLTVDCFDFILTMSVKVISNYERFKHKREDTWFIMQKEDDVALDDWKNATAPTLDSLVLILRDEVDDEVHTNGILAAYQEQESETLLVRYICRVVLIKETLTLPACPTCLCSKARMESQKLWEIPQKERGDGAFPECGQGSNPAGA